MFGFHFDLLCSFSQRVRVVLCFLAVSLLCFYQWFLCSCGGFELHFSSSSSSLSLGLLFFWCGAKTSNPAATNLVWAARPPFAHKDGLRVLNISGEAPDSLCLGAWSSICLPVLSVKRAHISWFFFTPPSPPLLFSCDGFCFRVQTEGRRLLDLLEFCHGLCGLRNAKGLELKGFLWRN